MSTKFKLNIIVVLGLIILGAIIEYYAIFIFKKNFISQRKITGLTILETVKNDLAFGVSIKNRGIIEKVAEKLLKVSYIDKLEIYIGDSVFYRNSKSNLSPINVEKIELLTPEKNKVVVKYILGLNLKDFKNALKSFTVNLSIIVIFLIFIIGIVLSILIDKFLEPVNFLITAVKESKYGKYKKIGKKFSSEIQALIDVYNNFIDSLKIKDEQLNSKIKELNEKINEIHALQKMIITTEKLASIGTMTAGIAHEINNPLAGIKGQAEVLLYIEEVKDEKIRNFLKSVISNCNRIAGIIKKLKGYSKITEEKYYFSIKDIILDTVDILKDSKKISENLKLTGNFLDKDVKIFCNRNEMIQVFLNLIENSYQASNENCIIEININEFSDRLEIFYLDNGSGIPEEIQDKIFDPFFTTKREKGTGLGMYIVSNIITSHNGIIEIIKSKKGAIFKITFFKKRRKP